MIGRLFSFLILLSFGLAASESFRVGFLELSTKAMRSSDFKIGMEMWIKETAQQYGITTRVRYYKDPLALAQAFHTGDINMAIATPLVFVKYFDPKTLLPGVVGFKTSKEKSSKMLLLVRKKEKNKSLRRLLKKPVAVPEIADTGILFMRYLSRHEGVDKDLRFQKTRNGNQAILKLFFGQTNMAVVSQATFDMANELNPQIGERLHVYRSTRLPVGSYAFVRKGIDATLYSEIIRHALELAHTTRGRQILILFQTDTVDLCTRDDLRSTETLYRAYTKCTRGSGRKKPSKGASDDE